MEINALDKKKKIITIIVFVVLAVLALGGIAGAFLMNYNTFPPAAPSILDDGGSVFITTSSNENYQGYRFKFEGVGEDIIIDSKENVLSAQQLKENGLLIGGNYTVSACYLGETEGSSSPYGASFTWVFSDYLEAPVITENEQEKNIFWQAVENADYYTIYYKDSGLTKSVQIQQQAGEEEVTFSYAGLAGGDKEFLVTAGSKNVNYKTSDYSNKIELHHTYSMQEIYAVSFDLTTAILTVSALEDIDYLKIYIDETDYVVKLLEPTTGSGKYVYKINIVSIYKTGAKIGVAPEPANSLSVFEGEIKYV